MKKALLFAAALLVAAPCFAQSKPGLWESTSTMTWDKSPIPPDALAKMQQMGMSNPFLSGQTFHSRTCVDQAMVDKFNGPEPQTQKDCRVENVVKSPTGMTANMVCTGRVTGHGEIMVTSVSGDHLTTHVHFAGSAGAREAEWTMDGTSEYKGASCGTLAPGKSELVH